MWTNDSLDVVMTLRQTLCAGILALTCLLAASPAALTASEDYEFRLVSDELAQSRDAIFAVTLVDKRSGTSVEDAIIFATRMDMEPDGMEAMTSPVEVLPTTEAGVYRFRTDLAMPGRWRLSVAAKVQGEDGTVQSRLVLRAVP